MPRMKVLALFSMVMSMLVCSVEAQSKSQPIATEAIGRERLSRAFVHANMAMDLTKGTAARPAAVYAKEAAGMSNADLRKETGRLADSIESNFSKTTTKLQQLDVTAHLHITFLALTSKRKDSFDEVRGNIHEKWKREQTTNHAGDLYRKVEAIHAALKAP
jgi:hypothetical protein